MKIFQTITILFILIHISNGGYCQLWKRNSDSAKFYSDKKDMDKAIEFYSKAKEGLEKDSAESNTYAGICNSLGTLYAKTGEYEQAEPLLLKAKEIREKLSGKDNLA